MVTWRRPGAAHHEGGLGHGQETACSEPVGNVPASGVHVQADRSFNALGEAGNEHLRGGGIRGDERPDDGDVVLRQALA